MLYDSLGRLEQWKHGGGGGVQFQREYLYNDFGTMTGTTTTDVNGLSTGQQTFTLGVGTNPFAVAGDGQGTYLYDAAGRRTDRNGVSGIHHHYDYNRWNLPTQITLGLVGGTASDLHSSFRYDADGHRASKTRGNETTYYLDGVFEDRVQNGTHTYVYFLKAGGRTIAEVSDKFKVGDTTTVRSQLYPHQDAVGSVTLLTNGTTTERLYYEPFGARVQADGMGSVADSASRHGFTGHEHDNALNLINMKGRIYDTSMRRFLTPDPLVTNAQLSQGWNPYAYVMNNPFRFADPSGLSPGVPPPPPPPPPPFPTVPPQPGDLIIPDGDIIRATRPGTQPELASTAFAGRPIPGRPPQTGPKEGQAASGGPAGGGATEDTTAKGQAASARAAAQANNAQEAARAGHPRGSGDSGQTPSPAAGPPKPPSPPGPPKPPGGGGGQGKPNPNEFQVWERPSQLGGSAEKYGEAAWKYLGYGHQWVYYPAGEIEAGMGPAPGGDGGYGGPTTMKDHPGAHRDPNAQLVRTFIVDNPAAVVDALKVGTPTGGWYVFVNDCHGAAASAIVKGYDKPTTLWPADVPFN
jgi:RHS repeat-associated protein